MKSKRFVIFALVVTLSMASTATAQFVVSDPATEAETLATALEAASNLEQIITLVTMLTSGFGVVGLLAKLDQKNQYPSANTLDREMFSTEKPASLVAGAITADRLVFGADKEGNLLREQIAGAANAAGVAANVLDAMDNRLEANGETTSQLSRSRNIMQATVTNGLILKQIHDAVIQNVQAISLLTMTTAQASLHEAEEAATQRKEHQETALTFGAAAMP